MRSKNYADENYQDRLIHVAYADTPLGFLMLLTTKYLIK